MRYGIRDLFAQLQRLWRPAITAVVVIAAWSRCIEWKQPTATEETTLANYVAGVQTARGDAIAALRTGSPPTISTGPVITAPIPQLVLLGGTIEVFATAPTPFTKVIVLVPTVNDYWELTLPAATDTVTLLIVFSQDIPKNVFEMRIGGSNGATLGTYQKSPVSVINVGTGDVQINVTWNSTADVDLHVVDPTGAEVYWAGKTSSSGGTLDLDSNAGCATDGPRAENVFWASGLIAPRGEYVVRVDYWSACAAVKTNYVVTVHAKGHPPQVFTGVFTGTGDGGGKGAGTNITRLQY